MHKTILIEEITIENVTEKINEKVQETVWNFFCKFKSSMIIDAA